MLVGTKRVTHLCSICTFISGNMTSANAFPPAHSSLKLTKATTMSPQFTNLSSPPSADCLGYLDNSEAHSRSRPLYQRGCQTSVVRVRHCRGFLQKTHVTGTRRFIFGRKIGVGEHISNSSTINSRSFFGDYFAILTPPLELLPKSM